MLRQLSIQNYAIIDRLEVSFCEGVNIITGETGAGKSIVLGALSLLLGERADSKALCDQDHKCVIEAEFDSSLESKKIFDENDLDWDTITVIRREVSPNGKSRSFVNDTPVTLNVLKALGEKLVNMHSQHETLDLVEAGFQMEVIDALAGHKNELKLYRSKFLACKKNLARLHALTEEQHARRAELDFLQFQVNELASARLAAGEQEALELEQGALENVEEIKHSVQAARQIISDGDNSCIDQLKEVLALFKNVSKVHVPVAAQVKRIEEVLIELKDIASEFEDIADKASPDPEKLEEINLRLSTIYRLQKKHGVADIEALLSVQKEAEQKILSFDNSSEAIEQLKEKLKTDEKELAVLAEKLHQSRVKAVPAFQKGVEASLRVMGMPGAVFAPEVRKLKPEEQNENGSSEINLLFSANKGFAPQQIRDVASGGELSRLMLAIKSELAAVEQLPTLVFDEIDAGISGEVAMRVGEIMRKMSRGHQLLCITHLPQIARIADRHFHLYKATLKGKTYTRIQVLEAEERITEIAKMLSGDKVSEASLANARELMGTT